MVGVFYFVGPFFWIIGFFLFAMAVFGVWNVLLLRCGYPSA